MVEGSSKDEAQVTIGKLLNVIAINNMSNGQAILQNNAWNHVYLRVCTCKSILIVYGTVLK